MLQSEHLPLVLAIKNKTPFKWLDEINEEMFENYFVNQELYDNVLDNYNVNKNQIKHGLKYMAFMETFKSMMIQYGDELQ